ncbi:hypothetical protein KR222_003988, partial [Zaprionus bogoriensis]
HKRAHYQQRELKQQQLLLSTLLGELRRATNHWFQGRSDDASSLQQQLVQTCVQILQHGLLLPPTSAATLRLIEDFEFLRLAEQQQQQQQQQQQYQAGGTVGEFLQQWVALCLRTRCLARCIQSLVDDKELLDCYYQRGWPYLRQPSYATALCVCLTAIQLDQSSLLSQLEPMQRRRHRRTCSQPNFSSSQRLHVVQEEELQQQQQQQQQQQLQQQQQQCPLPQQWHLLRRIKSLPSLRHNDSSVDNLQQQCDGAAATTPLRPRCQTLNSPLARWRQELLRPPLSGCSISTSTSSSSCSQLQTQQRIQLINCDNIKIWTDQTSSSEAAASSPAPVPPLAAMPAKRGSSSLQGLLGSLFGSPPTYTSWYKRSRGRDEHEDEATAGMLDTFRPFNGRKLDKRHRASLFEGVSMLDYNQEQDQALPAAMATATTSAPLDIVGASGSQSSNGSASGSSSRGQSASCSTTSCSQSSDSPHSAGGNKLDNQSLAAFLQTSRYTHNNTELEKENAHFRISEACIAAIEHVKWSRRGQAAASSAAATAAADAEALLMPYVEQHNNSAEAVGLQLISRFNDQQLPRLGDLKWLVSEQDAPQQLLPMPKHKHKPEQLQQHQHQQQQQQCEEESLTRGTQTWAPPRQQIIFTEHAPASRSQLLARQQYRCAGCGMHVTRQHEQHYRYCNYLGKYLCTGCHRNQLSAIPAKILQSWDFRCYAVSSFAYRLIEQMYTFPLFHVPDLNAQLYARQKLLARARRRRQQLRYVRDFIASCRFASREQQLFSAVPGHITNELDVWSMCDFVDVQNNSMCRSIEELIALSEQHVHSCVLCTGRAFVCEYCHVGSPKLIYPWQRRVQRCGQCGACAHSNCWKSVAGGKCQRCARLQGRTE